MLLIQIKFLQSKGALKRLRPPQKCNHLNLIKMLQIILNNIEKLSTLKNYMMMNLKATCMDHKDQM